MKENIPQTHYTRNLSTLGSPDLLIAGGKGASLGAMLHAGLPVPEVFAVLTHAYLHFVKHNRLEQSVRNLVESVRGDDQEALVAAAQALKDLFISGELPPEITIALVGAYRELGAGLVVVRSSATAEYLPGASFAGQHNSFLNIEGESAVCDAVRRCWGSLWNPRAVSYRKQVGLDTTGIAISVVVQRMIDAERSGVLFTANPLNQRALPHNITTEMGLTLWRLTDRRPTPDSDRSGQPPALSTC